MIPDCISFSAIPHTTRIFSDFLSYSPEIRKFYPTPPDAEHVVAFAKSVPRDLVRQARVADALASTTGGADPNANLMMAHYGNYLSARGLDVPAAHQFPFPVGGIDIFGSYNFDICSSMVAACGLPVNDAEKL